ncbi:hypothetical protein K493DRAFT_342388 [Basidiobolus meristosporus CBS 931.73]|uniref:Uncharacterized protein n=1 Tax=Basidiobolus meristosporus CBS 931.73 TaxID=1314790 RepID=A0A1Y1X6S1_9FUNG|nr:hypothetical protein K493DRAFT_342388 [Basidiobolus meristosporus CBS 931.73]|eukprot:ORX81395.1 hypothetical protein K493DRAFT_342388 [Basidiobolus meristosporus CBS 931.73]
MASQQTIKICCFGENCQCERCQYRKVEVKATCSCKDDCTSEKCECAKTMEVPSCECKGSCKCVSCQGKKQSGCNCGKQRKFGFARQCGEAKESTDCCSDNCRCAKCSTH